MKHTIHDVEIWSIKDKDLDEDHCPERKHSFQFMPIEDIVHSLPDECCQENEAHLNVAEKPQNGRLNRQDQNVLRCHSGLLQQEATDFIHTPQAGAVSGWPKHQKSIWPIKKRCQSINALSFLFLVMLRYAKTIQEDQAQLEEIPEVLPEQQSHNGHLLRCDLGAGKVLNKWKHFNGS